MLKDELNDGELIDSCVETNQKQWKDVFFWIVAVADLPVMLIVSLCCDVGRLFRSKMTMRARTDRALPGLR